MASELVRARRAASFVVALVLASPLAFADPTSAEKETARNHMVEGDKRRDAGDKEGALKSYEAADAIMHVPTTGLEVARTQAALGQLLEAKETLARVAKIPAKPNEPAPFVNARKAAVELANDVAVRTPSLAIVVANADPTQPVTLTLDNEPIPAQGADVPRKLNPGKHVVVAKSGVVEKREEVTLAEREQRTATLDVKPPPPPAPVETSSASSLARPMIYGGFGLAIVGVAVGSVTGIMSLSQTSDVKSKCDGNKCPPSTASDIDSAKSLGTVSTIAFVAGGVGAAIGVLGLFLAKGSSEPPPPASASLRPTLGPTWAGLEGRF